MKKALIVIDLQRGFLTEYTEGLAEKIRKFIDQNHNKYDLILFTQFRNKSDSSFVKNLGYDRFMEEKEFDIVDELKDLIKSENVFVKNTYSSFVTDKLNNILEKNRIEEVHLVGVDTENCVLTFARDVFDRGYKIVVYKDLCRSHLNPAMHRAALEIIANNIGEVK